MGHLPDSGRNLFTSHMEGWSLQLEALDSGFPSPVVWFCIGSERQIAPSTTEHPRLRDFQGEISAILRRQPLGLPQGEIPQGQDLGSGFTYPLLETEKGPAHLSLLFITLGLSPTYSTWWWRPIRLSALPTPPSGFCFLPWASDPNSGSLLGPSCMSDSLSPWPGE